MKYRIDTGVSRFTVRAFAAGLLSAFAHNPTFVIRRYDGEVHIDPDSGDSASLALTISAASIELTDDVSSRDREEIERIMREEVLEIERYPSIRYDAPAGVTSVSRTSDGHFTVSPGGDLTLHGATRHQAVTAPLTPNATGLRAYGELAVRQSDYGIRLVTAAGGVLKVKDEIRCDFDIVAHGEAAS